MYGMHFCVKQSAHSLFGVRSVLIDMLIVSCQPTVLIARQGYTPVNTYVNTPHINTH